jgi:hemerythrin superfamily protein
VRLVLFPEAAHQLSWEKAMAAKDAIALLKADHKEVAEMLEKFETARSTKEKLAQQICMSLTVHAQIEEEIFYPE